jgi:hypothetical protein
MRQATRREYRAALRAGRKIAGSVVRRFAELLDGGKVRMVETEVLGPQHGGCCRDVLAMASVVYDCGTGKAIGQSYMVPMASASASA